jgi:hypothetical protein
MEGVIEMTNFNLVIVENGNEICLANDVTSIEIDNNKLVYVCENGGCEDVFALDNTDSVIVEINR